ncbi:MAG: type 1 glutamine amidotransferase [Halobacteriaceae archaeon]
MERLRVALLNAAYDGENTRRNFRRELAGDLAEFNITDGDMPPSIDFDAAVVTGSKASVYWNEEWIEQTKSWVHQAIQEDLPLLGVCFGHQLIADVLGGTVEDMGDYEIGYKTISKVRDDPLFENVPSEFTAFTTHSDEVTVLPPGTVKLAENERSIQAFRKDHIFSVQFHPEYDMETAISITKNKDLDESRIQQVLDDITEERYAQANQTKALFDNFTDYIIEHNAKQRREV